MLSYEDVSLFSRSIVQLALLSMLRSKGIYRICRGLVRDKSRLKETYHVQLLACQDV